MIPSRMIGHMIQNSGSDMTLEEGCTRYFKAYMAAPVEQAPAGGLRALIRRLG